MKRFLNSYIIPPLVCALTYLISRTLRVVEINREVERELTDEGKPVIYTLWHGRLFFFPYYSGRKSRFKILVSPSADGEIIARALAFLRLGVVRGSSYKRARSALRELKRLVDEGYCVVMIADGSRGPIHQLQAGALMLSKLTGRPVLPVTVSYSSKWTLKSWDRLIIPKPFSTAVLVCGTPVVVPPDCDSARLEALRAQMETDLRAITGQADDYFTKS